MINMQFQVTQIEFDFDDALHPMTEVEMSEVYEDYIGTFWEADDGDDLVEEITSASVGVSSPLIIVTSLTETHD